MSEDALYKLIDELKENGVSAEVSELKGGKNGEIQKSLGISVKLDFSEHDSMLKGEIEKLKSELEYEKRNINYLRTRCMEDATDAFDSRAYGRLTIVGRRVDLEAENDKLKQKISDLESLMKKQEEFLEMKNIQIAELKQRIAELESKEMEKPTKLNLNDRVKVKLTPLGAEIYYHQCDDVNKKIKENGGTELEPIMPQIDKDGYTEFQLWHFIELYGKHIGMCKPNVIEPLDIVIVE